MSAARTSVISGLAGRNGGHVGLAVLLAILSIGLGLRTAEAWDGRPPVYDAAAYAKIAASLDRGDGFTLGAQATQPASNYSPGLPLFAAALYELSGGVHERFARLVLAVIGTLAVLFAYLIGRRLSGVFAGLMGAGAVAIYPALLEYQGMLMGEPLAATLLSGVVLAMLWAAGSSASRAGGAVAGVPHSGGRRAAASEHMGEGRRDRTRALKWLVPGLLLGALALVRPEYVGIAVPIAVVVLARRGWDGWREGLVQAAILFAGLAVMVAPWTVRNAVALDRFVPVSTGGGQVLFAGSYMPSGGDPEEVGREVLERHPGLARKLALERAASSSPSDQEPPLEALLDRYRLEQILAALAAQRYPGMETDEALARMGRERLWDDVTERPVSYAGFVAAKVWRIWSHGPRDVMREPVWTVFHLLLVALALVGLAVLVRQRRWEALLIGVVLLSATATGALLVASPRRVLVTLPLVAALAGVGAASVRGLLQQRIRH